MNNPLSRRALLAAGFASGAALSVGSPARAAPNPDALAPDLVARARAALRIHGDRIAFSDRIGIVDFASPSRATRFHIVDAVDGRFTSHLVAHGRGSDPAHTGWVTRLSNEPGSFASSGGAFVTKGLYVGGHGRSMRLGGLDGVNSNAEARALVVHAAWYVSSDVARATGKIGRSEGCFAVSTDNLEEVLGQLGSGRLIYASDPERHSAAA